jgi:hypothetical protein
MGVMIQVVRKEGPYALVIAASVATFAYIYAHQPPNPEPFGPPHCSKHIETTGKMAAFLEEVRKHCDTVAQARALKMVHQLFADEAKKLGIDDDTASLLLERN